MMNKRKRRADHDAEEDLFKKNSKKLTNPHVSEMRFTSIHGGQVVSQTRHKAYLEPGLYQSESMAVASTSTADPIPVVTPSENVNKLEPKPTGTQNSALLADFEGHIPLLLDLLIANEAHPSTETLCSCKRGERLVHCRDCLQFQPTCKDCFIDCHTNNPLHWAEVWNRDHGYFVRHDLSVLAPDFSIHLGHHGNKCPNARSPVLFTIVDTNGIHGTRLSFCGCLDAPSGETFKIEQLMAAGLFPGTTRAPQTAYTFRFKADLHLHCLESKKSVFDHLGATRRKSDNAFTSKVQDPQENMLRAFRVWRYLNNKKRSGHGHDIDRVFPLRSPGDICVRCPACPDPSLNMKEGWQETPERLRHLNQLQRTLDGNFQCNKMRKNTDPDDVSLYKGCGYFPNDTAFRQGLDLLPKHDQKSTCSFLKVVNKQNSSKFKNMDVTGTVNTQCSHVYILASVDLYMGERFSHVDYSLAHSLRRLSAPASNVHVPESINALYGDIDQITSYDAMCQYSVNLVSRFQASFPDVSPLVQKMRAAIPALHIMGHRDGCQYNFATAYMDGVGHFHGETAEHYWPEANQLGPQTRQMNNGHRQDTLIDNHSDWNWKKTANLTVTLLKDLKLAKQMYIEKRDHFAGLSLLYKGRVSEWDRLSRSITGKHGDSTSVYQRRSSKAPSQATIYQAMLDKEKDLTFHGNSTSVSCSAPQNTKFLNDGILIQLAQRKLQRKVAEDVMHPQASLTTEIVKGTSEITERLRVWRKEQKTLMPLIGDAISQQPVTPVEQEILFLPSDFDSQSRQLLELTSLAPLEFRLREGEACDALDLIRNAVKAVITLQDRKTKNDRGQDDNTRSTKYIKDAEQRREFYIDVYNHARACMIELSQDLGTADNNTLQQFPHLRKEDTFMKSRQKGRLLGDSRRTDGLIFTLTGDASDIGDNSEPKITDTIEAQIPNPTGTQMNRRKTVTRSGTKTIEANQVTSADAKEGKKKDRNEGWIWNTGGIGKLTEKELDEWSEECDRVQWFRAEAEMLRWMEQHEMKLAEFLRTLRSFDTMAKAWASLAESDPQRPRWSAGHVAYARQKSMMYSTMLQEGSARLDAAGYKDIREKDNGTNAELIKVFLAATSPSTSRTRMQGPLERDADERRPLLDDVEAKLTTTPTPTTATATTPTPLPLRQLTILCMLRVLDPLAFSQIFPYINNFVEDLRLTDDPSRVGFYSGLVESAFALAQLLAIYPWAWVSDVIGRRPVILLCVSGLAVTTFLFGLSTSFSAVMISRILAGLFTGNVAVIPSVLCEITDTSNQAVAFPIFGLFWPIGSIVGPLIGGSLSNPAKRFPSWFGSALWTSYPYFLPCLIACIVTVIVLAISYVFLEESLNVSGPTVEREAFGAHRDSRAAPTCPTSPKSPSIPKLLRTPVIQRLCVSGCAMNFVTTAFDVVFVLFCYTPIESGGLSFSESQIGYTLSISGALAAALQLFVMPTLLRKYDHAKMYTFFMGVWPLAFAALPVLNVIARASASSSSESDGAAPGVVSAQGQTVLWSGIVLCLCVARTGYLAHSLSMLLIKRYAPPSALASTNGLVQFSLCLARAVSPAFISSLFALSTEKNLVGGRLWVVVMLFMSIGATVTSKAIGR
ncbi:hypothetical protein EYR40_001322 [Pleurotus pulmonarius]|nr:hypothetical protein EYR40_001322 [Pleurotus pulmonarius]